MQSPRGSLAVPLFLLVLAALPGLAAASRIEPARGHERLVDELLGLRPDPARVAVVEDLLLERDAAAIALVRGRVALATPLRGRVCAAFFHGEGEFRLAPAQETERAQLVRLFKSPVFARRFDSALLLFADSTAEDLGVGVTFMPGEYGSHEPDVSRNLDGLVEGRTRHLDPSVGRTWLEGRRNRHFILVFRSGIDRFRFEYDPYRTEQVSLVELASGSTREEVLTQFPAGAAASDELDHDVEPTLDVGAYRLDAEIPGDLRPNYLATVESSVREDSARFLHFWLSGADRIDSVTAESGAALDHSVSGPPGGVWVDAGRSLRRGERLVLRFRYRGLPLAGENQVLTPRGSIGWYPVHDWTDRASIELRIRHPRGFTVTAAGDLVERREGDDAVESTWRCPEPTRNATFVLGKLEAYVAKSDSAGVTVLMNPLGHASAARALIEAGQLSGRDMERRVADDVLRSMKFFDHVYGPLGRRHLSAVDAWTSHSAAYPGLLGLGWGTMQWTDVAGGDDVLRAHEVAHQWWPLEVEPATYRDRWLSEGLAEFSGLWYLNVSRDNPALYLDALRDRRRLILENRDSGPPWLGHRAQSARTPGPDDFVATYCRGAWVFHMLRNMLIDLGTLDETRFIELMRDFHRTYRGRHATTADFRRVVEKHAGEDMNWFFDQWVRGDAIPHYRVAWKPDRDADGRGVVKLRVEQRRVPPGHQMPVLVRIGFENGSYTRARIWVDRALAEKEIAVPLPARTLEFNEFESVLCTHETVPYEANPK